MIAGAAAVVLGWIGYGIWEWRMRKLEREQPPARSERFQQATNSVSDYAKKLSEFKKPAYKRDDSSGSGTNKQRG